MKTLDLFRFVLQCLMVVAFASCGPANTGNRMATDSVSIAKGAALFQTNCSGCHNFKQDGIGPSLSGVTITDSLNWLQTFIRSPKTLADSGDSHVKELLANFHTLMPSFTSLKDEEVDELIAFLNTEKEAKKEVFDPLAIRDPVPEKIPASDVEAQLELFAQMPASSDKEPLTRISKMEWNASAKAWFILDQRGILYRMENGKPLPWLDMPKWKPHFINQPGLATGFGSFAFHPDFAHNGIFYTTHSEAAHSQTADFAIADSVKQILQWVLCEWKISGDTAAGFKGSCRELMRIDMVAQIHGVQDIIFNPLSKPGREDYGLLYIGVGDGGAVENGQAGLTHHPDKIWGSILRIDPMGKNSANGQYGIPDKNPYTKNKDKGAVREIYADGFRNPNLITWTRKGQMLVTNIGQSNIEAIDMVEKGGHYGWPDREGRFAMHPGPNMNKIYPVPSNDSLLHITYPVAEFDHDEGNAIAGGFEYTGSDIPLFTGKYLFGDIPSGRLFYVNTDDLAQGKLAPVKEWFVTMNGKRESLRTLCGQNRVDLRFAKDEKGELYIFTKPDGKIYRLKKQ